MSILVNTSCDNKLEIFETIQGEGTDVGLPAFFIRLQGCSVHCFFCDEKETWVKRDNNSISLEPELLIKKLEELNPLLKRVVITGGEPTEQDLDLLIKTLVKNSYKVSIETAATGEYCYQIFENDINITFSPKEIYSSTSKIADDRIWAKANELKFVVASPDAPEYLIKRIIPKLSEHNNNCPIFLVPDWYNLDATKAIILDLLKEYPSRFRLGVQMHKVVDLP